jgi:hypothetical protein
VQCLLLAACAVRGPDAPLVELPTLRLPPAALGHELALQQRLVLVRDGQRRELDALLEVDAAQVRLLVQAMGLPGVHLIWDGQHMDEQRAPWLPPQVRGERVLSDLQFALWPLPAVRAALPPSWQVEQVGDERRLLDAQHRTWLVVHSDGGLGNLNLRNLAEGYALEVRSAPMSESGS